MKKKNPPKKKKKKKKKIEHQVPSYKNIIID